MNRLRWSNLAFHDLQAISQYIELQRDLVAANRVCRTIYDTVQLLVWKKVLGNSSSPGCPLTSSCTACYRAEPLKFYASGTERSSAD